MQAVYSFNVPQSTSNEAWDRLNQEPFIFDATLTQLGQEQADFRCVLFAFLFTNPVRQRELEASGFKPQLVVTSPLTRAIQTAERVCSHYKTTNIPFIVHPLCREIVSGADDIGR